MIPDTYKNIVVIGGNSAGLAAANQARRFNAGIDIKVLEAGSYISYGSCSLPYYIAGKIEKIDSILNYSPEYFREKRNIQIFLKHRVVSVNTFKKELKVETDYCTDGCTARFINYDRLIICSGASPILFDIEGADSKNVFSLRKVDDALDLRNHIEKENPRKAVIVGGGNIGLLIAEALCKRGMQVSIIEMKDRVFSNYENEVTGILQDVLLSSGVKIFFQSRLTKINQDNDTGNCYSVLIESIKEKDARISEIGADIVVIAAGIRPNTGFLSSSSLDLGKNGAIKVSSRQQTTQANIYAAGDCCLVRNIITKSYDYMPTAGIAIKSGRVAGANAAGEDATFEGGSGTSVDRIFGYEIAKTGIGLSEALEYKFDAIKISDEYASHIRVVPGAAKIMITIIVDRKTGRLLGTQMIGKDGVGKRIDVFAAAIAGGMTVYDIYMIDTSYAPYVAVVPDAVNRICGKAIILLKT